MTARSFAGLLAGILIGAVLWPLLCLLSLVAGLKRKPVDVGLGPHPLINNVYHKKALTRRGYTAETFVYKTYYITDDFDIDIERRFGLASLPLPANRLIAALLAFALAVWRYRLLYIYFNGGPLSVLPGFLGRSEALFFHLAGVKTVVMPYGSDVQDMTRSPNLYFKHAMTLSYPARLSPHRRVARNIDYWTANAHHVLSGVEWVDYMPHWDTLMLGHFSIDCDEIRPAPPSAPYVAGARPLRILHAPNHRHLKGTDALLSAVGDLKRRGHAVDLVLVERKPNREVLAEIARADLIVDQLVIGWYAMLALEAMALGKPVVCHIRDDLAGLYQKAGLLGADELPFLNADVLSIGALIERAVAGAYDLAEIGRKGRRFVERHHSLAAVGATFDRINRSIGVAPRNAAAAVGPTTDAAA